MADRVLVKGHDLGQLLEDELVARLKDKLLETRRRTVAAHAETVAGRLRQPLDLRLHVECKIGSHQVHLPDDLAPKLDAVDGSYLAELGDELDVEAASW